MIKSLLGPKIVARRVPPSNDFLPTVVGVMRFGGFYQRWSFSANADKSLVGIKKTVGRESLVGNRW